MYNGLVNKMKFLILAVAVLAIVGTIIFLKTSKKPTAMPPTFSPQTQQQEDQPRLSVYAKNLTVPWALVFLPNGDLLVTERGGNIYQIDKDGNRAKEPVAKLAVLQTGESGLHGITLSPNFENNRHVFIYYTYKGKGDNTLNRVSRFKFDGKSLSEEKVIVEAIPGAIFHDGGRIKFGPDGFLYITCGDALNPSLAQDTNSLAGKILRVTEDGQAAPGNPFGSAQDKPFGTPVYSWGHRNPQGIAWDDKGRLWETEHGQSATDEVNLIVAGKNYGWPTIRGDETQEGMQNPALHSKSDTWAPAGAVYINGSIFFGGLRGQALYEAKIEEDKVINLTAHFKGELGRIRDVIVGPDGFLYVTTSNRDGRGNPAGDDDKILRVNPAKLSSP